MKDLDDKFAQQLQQIIHNENSNDAKLLSALDFVKTLIPLNNFNNDGTLNNLLFMFFDSGTCPPSDLPKTTFKITSIITSNNNANFCILAATRAILILLPQHHQLNIPLFQSIFPKLKSIYDGGVEFDRLLYFEVVYRLLTVAAIIADESILVRGDLELIVKWILGNWEMGGSIKMNLKETFGSLITYTPKPILFDILRPVINLPDTASKKYDLLTILLSKLDAVGVVTCLELLETENVIRCFNKIGYEYTLTQRILLFLQQYIPFLTPQTYTSKIATLVLSENDDVQSAGVELLSKLSHVEKGVIEQDVVEEVWRNVLLSNPNAKAVLATLTAIKRAGLDEFLDSIYESVIPYLSLTLQTSFQLFEFIAESFKETSELKKIEFLILEDWIKDISDCETSEGRMKIQSPFKKLVSRIRKTIFNNVRELSNLEDEFESVDLEKWLKWKVSWWERWNQTIVQSLYPTSKYQKTTLYLTFLKSIQETEQLEFKKQKKEFINQLKTLCPGLFFGLTNGKELFDALVSIIVTDKYESNRNLAFDILKHLEWYGDEELLRVGIRMISRIRSSTTECGASLLRLIFLKAVLEKQIFFNFGLDVKINKVGGPEEYFLNQMIYILNERADKLNSEPLISSYEYPFHGFLLSLSLMFQDIKNTKERANVIRPILKSLVPLCESCCVVALDVLSDDSPEGNIPPKYAKTVPERLLVKGPPHQILTTTSFRTIKQAVNLLYCLVCCVWVLDENEVERCGEWIRQILVSIRHRGAFTAVSETFTALCEKLGSFKEYKSLPESWLEKFLFDVSSEDAFVTRRSGGLPLGILGIVKSSTNKSKVLENVITKLVEIAKLDVFDEIDTFLANNSRFDLPGVHALNVLRVIFQDGSLAQFVRGYLGKMLILILKAFQSKKFPIRNCAAMMFSAILNKVLGVKALHEPDASNMIDGREFFSRYPMLHPVLVEELGVSSDLLQKGQMHESLYPMLTILSYLKSSGNTDECLSPFHDILLKCCSTPIYKVREMCCRAFASIYPTQHAPEKIFSLLKKLENEPCKQNTVHSLLLLIFYLTKRFAHAKGLNEELKDRIAAGLLNARWLFENNLSNVTKELAIRIFYFYCQQGISGSLEIDRLDARSLIGSSKLLEQQAIVLLNSTQLNEKVILDCLSNSNYEVQAVAIKYLIEDNRNVMSKLVQNKLIDLFSEPNLKLELKVLAAKLLLQVELAVDNESINRLSEALLLHNTRILDSNFLMYSIPLAAKLHSNFSSNDNASSSHMVNILKRCIDLTLAPSLRISVIGAIDYLVEQITNHKPHDETALEISLILFELLDDEDDEVRLEAYLRSEKLIQMNFKSFADARMRLLYYLLSSGTPSTLNPQSSFTLIEYLLRKLLNPTLIDVRDSNIDLYSETLFEEEPVNPWHDEFEEGKLIVDVIKHYCKNDDDHKRQVNGIVVGFQDEFLKLQEVTKRLLEREKYSDLVVFDLQSKVTSLEKILDILT
ncbi:hypothetical protein HK098_006708 [Nowakowskiella sp. JEL0407]|nr:hypothetical protein HK098_006708 [Nowakowskiella sp. JEL0407]